MTSNKKTARIAGFIYLIIVLTGIFSLMYVPSKLIKFDDPALTVRNIASSDVLYRLSMVSSLICFTAFVFLPLVLYKLLSPVHEGFAKLMVILVLISVPISFVNILNEFAVLSLVTDPRLSRLFSDEQLQAQVMLSLRSYNNGNLLAGIFWGLWLFPFGYLVFKSGLLPKILGVLLMIGCFTILIEFIGIFLIPGYSRSLISTIVSIPSSIGEIGTCLWLLIMGAKDKPSVNTNIEGIVLGRKISN